MWPKAHIKKVFDKIIRTSHRKQCGALKIASSHENRQLVGRSNQISKAVISRFASLLFSNQ